MKKIVIYTNQYIEEVQESGIFMKSEETGPYKKFHFEYTSRHFPILIHLLQNILLNENPITRNSKKIRMLVIYHVFSDLDARIQKDWSESANRWKEINMDGYIRFSLNDYREQINFLLYRLVKNHLVLPNSNI